jgi:phosphoribosylformylglycinamidine cyclo-ligase
MDSKNKYDLRGVSASKEDVHNAIRNIDKGLFPKAFCKVVPDILGGDPDYCNIMHADGAGTKSALAYLYWKETGDLSVWKGIAQDAIVMNLDDLLCVGAVDNILISSTIGRNKNNIPGEVISAIISGTEEFCAELRDMGINIGTTGGETADVGDIVRTIIVDSTVACRMKRAEVISADRIKAGDCIIGLSSSGKASYEKEYNGGMGSNGLTSARHDVFARYLAEQYPESYDPAVSESLVFSGKYKLTDLVEGTGFIANKNVCPGGEKSIGKIQGFYFGDDPLFRWGTNKSAPFYRKCPCHQRSSFRYSPSF